MPLPCTRCEGTGFLNIHQMPEKVVDEIYVNGVEIGLKWIEENDNHDVSVCDCCGDGETEWYGVPGEHYNSEDPMGQNGPYAYNGGLCECH